MEIYTPGFNKIRRLLYPIILDFLGKYGEASGTEIMGFIKKMKGKEEKKFKLIDFVYRSLADYSDQIQEVLVDMIRLCLVDQTRFGYKLSLLGKDSIGKDFDEIILG
ncbi:MAG: hypothetical protein IB617_02535 [Candidatus Nealsonbacteria bacterium]|nr:MAG: hypothetical protein IB617_02535 [Candidatus Nealsonbacteria bacterium]